ncbi:MAG: Phosphoribosylaminoimidazole-succinocarboxamide synthase [Chloroflexi bacterium]|jgi:phosphoribosylaminoimidazole-succinocarboxamide synthase|nr:Phosphoribosylaminoimidazole-succinocarboxamide synthase [Chloroflexota bacterium]
MTLADGFVRSGKVRDLYAVDDERLLLIASDRVSAFDVVMPTPIPDKGRVLTGLSRFWFRETACLVANHLLETDPTRLPAPFRPHVAGLRGRMMLCRRAEVLPVECVVRGYLSGSGWKDYRSSGVVSGLRLPPGLRESDRLPEPLFTPSTKAERGHDEPISFDAMVQLLRGVRADGDRLAERVRDLSLRLYRYGAAVCRRAGIILADTKFEFGVDPGSGELLLVDEVLTPDSSRFWEAAAYQPGRPQASFDKQFLRDWLETQPWGKTPPGPALPPEVVAGTRERYVAAYERITGASFTRYVEEDVIGR